MRGVFGRRTVVEAVFLVAVPVIVLTAGQSPSVIIASAGLAYLVVLLFEIGVWRSRPEARSAAAGAAPAADPPETVRVLPNSNADAAPAEPAEPVAGPEPPSPAPEPAAKREPEHVRVLRPVPPPAPEPIAPPPEPEPEPELPPAAAQPQTVVPIGVGPGPRQWNLWDLERLVREHTGQDEVRDEERSFLLLYLRDFAGPDGLLPIDFDGLVRDSFGDLVAAREAGR